MKPMLLITRISTFIIVLGGESTIKYSNYQTNNSTNKAGGHHSPTVQKHSCWWAASTAKGEPTHKTGIPSAFGTHNKVSPEQSGESMCGANTEHKARGSSARVQRNRGNGI